MYAKELSSDPSLLDMNTVGAFTGWNVWADSGLEADTNTTDGYFGRCLAPDGMPEGYERVVKFNAVTMDTDQWPNVYIRSQLSIADIQSCMEQGYSDVSFWLYVENAAGSSRNELQIRLLPDVYSEQNIQTGTWVEVKIGLSELVDQMNAETGQVRIFWATAPGSANDPIAAIWMTGFTLSK